MIVYANEYLRCAIVIFDKIITIRSSANPLVKIKNEYTNDKIDRQYKKEQDFQHNLHKKLAPSKFKSEMIRLGFIEGEFICHSRISCSVCKTRRCLK